MQIELNELAELLRNTKASPETKPRQTTADIPNGNTVITIADRGFVWVGKTTVSGDFATIENAKNIRIWGTTKGIGELRDGPLTSTKTDECGTVTIPMRAVIGFIKCTRDW